MRQITIPADGWTLYPNRGKGGRTIGGKFVTISPVGNLTISAELTRGIPKDKPYACIDYHEPVRLLRLVPCSYAVDSAIKIMMPGKGRGVSARMGTAGGFKRLGLVPKEPISYEAEWLDGSIIVDMASRFGGASRDASVPGDTTTRVFGTVTGEPEKLPGPLRTQAKRTCETCLHRSPTGMCRCFSSLKKNQVVALAYVCNQHVFRHPVATPPQARPPRQGSRPRAMCPECGHTISVSAKGLMPHDTDGMIFTGKTGEREKRCPGSNRQVPLAGPTSDE